MGRSSSLGTFVKNPSTFGRAAKPAEEGPFRQSNNKHPHTASVCRGLMLPQLSANMKGSALFSQTTQRFLFLAQPSWDTTACTLPPPHTPTGGATPQCYFYCHWKLAQTTGGELNQLVKVHLQIRTVQQIKTFRLLCLVKISETQRVSGGERETEELSVKALIRIEGEKIWSGIQVATRERDRDDLKWTGEEDPALSMKRATDLRDAMQSKLLQVFAHWIFLCLV